jgi:hypothetical protein
LAAQLHIQDDGGAIVKLSAILTITTFAALAGCAAPVSSSGEAAGETEQALSNGGISATVSSATQGYSGVLGNFTMTVVVTNGSNGVASNWQVGLNAPSLIIRTISGGAETLNVDGVLTVTPGPTGQVLAAGASVTVTISGQYSGTWFSPAVVAVDGEANGTAGVSTDGVDHIARAAASGALGVAFSYENNKLPNNGDPNYAYYDGLIWSAQSYVISNGQIAFDPNVPGYQFIPQQAMAALATVQQDPSVAEYLVAGLQSCFTDTSGQWTYYFDAATLRGFPTTTSGTLPGIPIPPSSYRPSPYNPVDTYTVSAKAGAAGAEIITITEKSTTDYWFGLLTSGQFSNFGSPNSVLSKFTGGSSAMCSPFNGPGGGTTNPYLIITQNGAPVGARQQQVGAQCMNGCTSTIVLDPIAYTIPGPQYDTSNNLLGPQNNPFTLDPTDIYADPTHYRQFSTNPSAQYGTFSKSMTFFGSPVEKFLLCGVSGSGC